MTEEKENLYRQEKIQKYTAIFKNLFRYIPWLKEKTTGWIALLLLCMWRWTGVNMLYFIFWGVMFYKFHNYFALKYLEYSPVNTYLFVFLTIVCNGMLVLTYSHH